MKEASCQRPVEGSVGDLEASVDFFWKYTAAFYDPSMTTLAIYRVTHQQSQSTVDVPTVNKNEKHSPKKKKGGGQQEGKKKKRSETDKKKIVHLRKCKATHEYCSSCSVFLSPQTGSCHRQCGSRKLNLKTTVFAVAGRRERVPRADIYHADIPTFFSHRFIKYPPDRYGNTHRSHGLHVIGCLKKKSRMAIRKPCINIPRPFLHWSNHLFTRAPASSNPKSK